MNRRAALLALAIFVAGVGTHLASRAQSTNDIESTPHNLSVSGPGTVRANSESQVCVFCHTPHGATNSPGAPLWNRALSEETYTTYSSSSLDAETIAGQLAQPAGSSKLCLSCHDGTLAISSVNVLTGQVDVTIPITGAGPGDTMPAGAGVETGFTRNLGTDLSNDHPISLTYDTTLANADGELLDPAVTAHIAIRQPGVRPPVPLENTGPGGAGQVQCATCHDPHVIDTSISPTNKFLRLKRFQQNQPAGQFDADTDINCLACHEKDGWSTSAHADPQVADETYQQQPAQLREFPNGLPVWQAACLNCHDTHSVHGSRRLLREGTDAPGTPKSGGQSAIEETCYQCHSAAPIVNNPNGDVADIQTEFGLGIHMPITTADQRATTEVHDIVDGDLIEPRGQLGRGDHNNRHAECTDCHNPHRVMRNTRFDGVGTTAQATHDHSAGHTNIASGVLRGSWGVEPVYGNDAFLSLPTTYEVKRGDGGVGASASVNAPHVTREYQVCLKCHSDYGFNDDGVYPIGTRPNVGASGGATLSGTNDLEQYTNQAMEFQAPLGDRGAPGGNHRSWHPVIDSTGRSAGTRTVGGNMFLAPWNGAANIGTQTIYCSDCHGRNTNNGTSVPPGGTPWGPHGSENEFLLKGTWNQNTGGNQSGICFRCHNHAGYATEANRGDEPAFSSGFGNNDRDTNLHAYHAQQVNQNLQCTWCHVAVPHGWKNKALLVNLNDVGAEAGLPDGTEVSIPGQAATFTQGPYYLNAKLKILNFAESGTWSENDCGSASGQGGIGRDWMENVCTNPP